MPEILDITLQEVKPYDLMGELGLVRDITWSSDKGWLLTIGPAWSKQTTLPGGMVEWGDLREIPYPSGKTPVRVIRGAPIPPLPVLFGPSPDEGAP